MLRSIELKIVKAEGERWQKMLNAQLTGLEPSLQKLQAESQIIASESLVASRQAEAALEPLGRFVSFSRDVAPIFAATLRGLSQHSQSWRATESGFICCTPERWRIRHRRDSAHQQRRNHC